MDFCAGDTVATVDATVLAEVLDVQPIPMKGMPAGQSVTTYMQPRVEIDNNKKPKVNMDETILEFCNYDFIN